MVNKKATVSKKLLLEKLQYNSATQGKHHTYTYAGLIKLYPDIYLLLIKNIPNTPAKQHITDCK